MKKAGLRRLVFATLTVIGCFFLAGQRFAHADEVRDTVGTTLTRDHDEDSAPLSADEIKKVKEAVKAVDAKTKKAFDTAFAKWKHEWRTSSETRMSSRTTDAGRLDTYPPLKSMGKKIIPLVINELLEEGNFFALSLYDDLQQDASKKSTLGIEQERAIHTVRLWLSGQTGKK